MPNITIYLDDETYNGWFNLSPKLRKNIREEMKEHIQKKIVEHKLKGETR